MSHIENTLAAIFGGIFIALSGLITVEVLVRKLFGISLQGSSELGGYALALGATLAFTLALFGRNHIRVDVFYERLPAKWQSWLNWLSSVLMAGFAAVMGMLAWGVVRDTLEYQSTAPTPWATPLIYPQTFWFVGQVIFMLMAFGIALRASLLLIKRRTSQLNQEFNPRSVKEELSEEIASIEQRSKVVGL